MSKLIFEDASWNFEQLGQIAREIEKIEREEMGLDPYDCQVEIVDFDQMLAISAGSTLPNQYNHWSFGKHYAQERAQYENGVHGLAYECVTNIAPSQIYCMDSNTSTMQALVIAHAMGHSHVFKNNYLFKDNTFAHHIVDYMEFARTYIHKCEETYGVKEVEKILDAGHALMWNSISPRQQKRASLASEQQKFINRRKAEEAAYNELYNNGPSELQMPDAAPSNLPEYNLLYYIEKHSPILKPWQREILRIVRKFGEFYYPSMQCSVVHESAAVYSHMFCMRRMFEKGFITEGAMLEAIATTANVTYQETFKKWRGFNIYTLGYNIAKDIERICLQPTDEDKRWFPDFAGNGEVMKTLRYAWENFNDETFIRQFLSPTVMRDMKMFTIEDDFGNNFYEVKAIHDDEGYRKVRSNLADEYLLERKIPTIAVTNRPRDSSLHVTHFTEREYILDEESGKKTMALLHSLWGGSVAMLEKTRNGEEYITNFG